MNAALERIEGASIPTFVVDTRAIAERVVADEIVALMRTRPTAVLGLATGDTPIGVYRELCAAHRAGGVSFARATTFNLDEYLDLDAGDGATFREWMQEQFFRHVDLARENAHLPESKPADPNLTAERYEAAITAQGGLDLQILGIGRNGHIGFNEPGSSRDSCTRVVRLHEVTRSDAVRAFGALARVPTRAITMGIATILDARRVRVLAFGARKKEIVRRTLLDPRSSACPSTFLRDHGDVKLFVDREAAALLHHAR